MHYSSIDVDRRIGERAHLERSARMTLMVLLIGATIAAVLFVSSVAGTLGSVGHFMNRPSVLGCQIVRDPATGSVVQNGCNR